jgi:cobalamin biosynthesis protein CobT
MPGMKNNLAVMLDDRYAKAWSPLHRPAGRAAGRSRRPDRARKADRRAAAAERAQMWSISGGRGSRKKAHDQFAPEGKRSTDQQAFARVSRDMIAALDMADELATIPTRSDENEDRKPKKIPASARKPRKARSRKARSRPSRDGRRRRNPNPPRWKPTSSTKKSPPRTCAMPRN